MHCVRLLVFASLFPTGVAAAESWPAVPADFGDGWTFTPSFSPSGDVAWFHHWAEPLNVEAPQEVFRVRRTESGWTRPEPVSAAPGRLLDWPHVTPDGRALILSIAERLSDRTFDFDLYGLGIEADGTLGEPRRLGGEDLNRSKTPENAGRGVVSNEFGARLSDAGELVFWSEREDAVGGRDIFFASPVEDGWDRPTPFEHDTGADESHPWIDRAGELLLFASDRPGSRGGTDLWVSARDAGERWSEPCRLPDTVNSVYEEEAPVLDPVAGTLLFTSNRPVAGRAGFRVYEVELPAACGLERR